MESPTPSPLEGYREQLDALDAQLINLLQERFSVTAEIGAYKRKNGLPAHQPERAAALLADRTKAAELAGLDPAIAGRIFEAILAESTKAQEDAAMLRRY